MIMFNRLSKILLICSLCLTSCYNLKVTNIVDTTNEGCIYYFWDKKVERWRTVVDTCDRFELGYKIKYEEFLKIEK